MKLNDFLAANTGNEIANNVIIVHVGEPIPYFSVHCEMPETVSPEIEAMRETIEEFFDYLDERS